MNTTVEKLSSNQVKIHFVVEPDVFEKGMQSAYRKVVKRVNIPGFRKGKAPRKVIELQYGESIFYEEAFDDIFPDLYREAVKEHDLNPVDRPSLDVTKIGSGEPLEFDVEVYVRPDVELGVYKGVSAHRHEVEVTEDDVKAEIERARERISRFIDVEDRPVKLDDQINLNYAGSVDGVAFEGGTADEQTLVIGSGNFIPGFEEQLIGAEIGQELDVNVTFPEPYHSEELAGKAAVFHVKINGIQEKEVPALDDEFAKDVSEFETFADYKNNVRETLEKQAKERGDNDFENHVVEAVVENATVDIPGAMIDDQLDSIMRDMEMRMMYQGMRLEDYFRYTGQSAEQMRDMYREEAERRVKTQLVLEAIRDAEAIEASEEEIEQEMVKFAERSKREIEEFKATLTDNDREYFDNIVRMEKTVDLLKAEAIETEDHDHDEEHDHDHGDDCDCGHDHHHHTDAE